MAEQLWKLRGISRLIFIKDVFFVKTWSFQITQPDQLQPIVQNLKTSKIKKICQKEPKVPSAAKIVSSFVKN